MAKSTLTTINQIMSIASKAHYLNGGNASKILAKDKKGIFTIEQVATTLNVDPNELKELLQQQGIMCGDYVITEEWGDGEKLSTFALKTLNDHVITYQQQTEQGIPTWLCIIVVGILCSMFNAIGCWYAGLLPGFVMWYLMKNGNKIDKQYEEQTKKLQDSLEENHKAKGMM